jgi:hypothetical protein
MVFSAIARRNHVQAKTPIDATKSIDKHWIRGSNGAFGRTETNDDGESSHTDETAISDARPPGAGELRSRSQEHSVAITERN